MPSNDNARMVAAVRTLMNESGSLSTRMYSVVLLNRNTQQLVGVPEVSEEKDAFDDGRSTFFR